MQQISGRWLLMQLVALNAEPDQKIEAKTEEGQGKGKTGITHAFGGTSRQLFFFWRRNVGCWKLWWMRGVSNKEWWGGNQQASRHHVWERTSVQQNKVKSNRLQSRCTDTQTNRRWKMATQRTSWHGMASQVVCVWERERAKYECRGRVHSKDVFNKRWMISVAVQRHARELAASVLRLGRCRWTWSHLLVIADPSGRLVVALRGPAEVVLEELSQVLERRTILWRGVPHLQHQVEDRRRTVVGLLHAVTTLHALQRLRVAHTWWGRGRGMRFIKDRAREWIKFLRPHFNIQKNPKLVGMWTRFFESYDVIIDSTVLEMMCRAYCCLIRMIWSIAGFIWIISTHLETIIY